MTPLLHDAARALLTEEEHALERLHDLLVATEAPEATRTQLRDMIAHLGDLFLVVVVGEFNAGKSSVMNALFGTRVMEEGPVPTTAKITLLRHGDEPLTRQLSEFVTERRVPAELLQHLTLVDTPGTNSIVQQHQTITEDFVPRSDLVLFVTSFDRPLTDSERQFLAYIRDDWGRRLVVVLNKADLAETPDDLRQVIDYLETNLGELLGTTPRILPVSARAAWRAKQAGTPIDPEHPSGFAALEAFLRDTLAGPEQVALKLAAPLETGQRLLEQTDKRLTKRRALLSDDADTLDAMERHLDDARTTLEAQYEQHLAAIEDVFAHVRRRGTQFLDDHIRVSRLQLLRNKDAFKARFEEQVVDETTRQIEHVVTDAVDDVLTQTMSLQQRLLRTFAERVRAATQRADALGSDQMSYDRKALVEGIMDTAARELRTHNVQHEVQRIVENVYDDATLTVGAGVGAAAAGGLGIVLLITSTVDALGGLGLATGAAAALYGATILPRQRRKAIEAFTERIAALEGRVQDALRARLDRSVDEALERVWQMVQPFAAAVAQEQEALAEATAAHTSIADELQTLRTRVRDEVGAPRV